MNNYLCFDVGGSAVKYGVINEEGKILHSGQFKTPSQNCRETVPRAMLDIYERLKGEYTLRAIGVSTAGQVEPDGSGVRYAVGNIKNYYPTHFRRIFEEQTGLPTVTENDVNAVALGEHWLGAAKGESSFLCITIGTGIGGAIFADGRLLRGAHGGAGEFGHMTIEFNGKPCICGQRGCFEAYASHNALLRDFRDVTGMDIGGKELFKLIRAGELSAERVFRRFTDYLAMGLAGLIHALDPGLVIIGGAISKEGAFFTDLVESALHKYAMPSYMAYTRVVPAALENSAGMMGACYAAIRYADKKLQ